MTTKPRRGRTQMAAADPPVAGEAGLSTREDVAAAAGSRRRGDQERRPRTARRGAGAGGFRVAAAGDQRRRRRGMICEARLVDGLSDEEVQSMFNAAREADYDSLAKDAFGEALETEARGRRPDSRGCTPSRRRSSRSTSSAPMAARRGGARWPGRRLDQEGAMAAAGTTPLVSGDQPGLGHAARRLRRSHRVAWLIRRFIDPEATFKFVARRITAPAR